MFSNVVNTGIRGKPTTKYVVGYFVSKIALISKQKYLLQTCIIFVASGLIDSTFNLLKSRLKREVQVHERINKSNSGQWLINV